MGAKAVLISIAMLLFLSSFAYAQVTVIVNADNPITSASQEQVANYFLKKETSWSNGMKVVPVYQEETSSIHAQFAKRIIGKTVSALKAYWNQNIFSGRAIPPAIKTSDQKVVSFVGSNQGAIGYVSGSAGLSGVKVLKVR